MYIGTKEVTGREGTQLIGGSGQDQLVKTYISMRRVVDDS